MLFLREANSSDLPFIEQRLLDAFFWAGVRERPPLAEMRARPEFAMLLAGWGRTGDVALVAEDSGVLAGAAWFRLWTKAEHSYGFVDERTPELGLAVAPLRRGQGIGRGLLRALVARALELGYPALSLSVAPANPARQLYESEGFRRVGESGSSWTLLRQLG